MLTDHAGTPLEAGQRVTMDCGHTKGNDWAGEVVSRQGILCYRYRDSGDEVMITEELSRDIEIIIPRNP